MTPFLVLKEWVKSNFLDLIKFIEVYLKDLLFAVSPPELISGTPSIVVAL